MANSNWDKPIFFTVKALKDVDLEDVTITLAPVLSLSIHPRTKRAGDYTTSQGGPPDVKVTAKEVVTPLTSPTLSTTTLNVAEGETAQYTVNYPIREATTVTVDIPVSHQNKATVQAPGGQPGASAELRFKIMSRDPYTVTVTASRDTDTADESFDLTHTAPAGYQWSGGDLAVAVAITDAGTGLNVSALKFDKSDPAAPSKLSEGHSATYTVSLKSWQSGTVTVTPTSDFSSVTVSPTTLTFNGGNWSEPQTVTVTAIEDENAFDEKATISHAISGYGDVDTGPEIKVNVDDDEHPVSAKLTLRMTGKGVFKEGSGRDTEAQVEVELFGPDGYQDRLPQTDFILCYTPGTLDKQSIKPLSASSEGIPDNCIDWSTRESVGLPHVVRSFDVFELRYSSADPPSLDLGTVTVTLKAHPTLTMHDRVSISSTEKEFEFRAIDSTPTQIEMTADGDPASINEGSGRVSFDVALSRRLIAGEEVRIPLVASGAGITDDDYLITLRSGTGATLSAAAPYTLTLAGAGAKDVVLQLTAVEDRKNEGGTNETLTLTLGEVTSNLDVEDLKTFGAGGTELKSAKSFSVDIVDGITLSLSAGAAVTEGGDAVFTVTANPNPSAPLTAKIGIAQTGAFVADADIGTDKTLTIPVTGSADYTVKTLDDTTDEPDGAVTATLIDSSDYSIKVGAGGDSVTVKDNDATTVRLSVAPTSVSEGGDVTVTATLSLVQAADVTIPITASVESGDSAEEVDFSAPASIVIKAGDLTGSADIATVKDADKDTDTFTVALGTLPAGLVAGTPDKASISITDDGEGATVNLSVDATTVKDVDDVRVTATLSHVFASDITVPLRVTATGANPAETTEWVAPGGIAIPKGSATASVAIDIIRDQDEADETFTVSLDSPLPTNLSAGATDSKEITIDDDGLGHNITLSAEPNPVDEGSSTTITATANGSFDADTVIPLTFKGHGSSKAEDGDYEAPDKVTIASGATSGSVTLSANGDRDEDDDVVRVALGTPVPAGVIGGNHQDITITDTGVATGPTLTLSIDPEPDSSGDIQVDEGSAVTFTATLDQAWSQDITLELASADSGDSGEPDHAFLSASEDDYTTLSNITIAKGKTSGKTTVTAVADGATEPGRDEVFRVGVLATKLPDLVSYTSDHVFPGSDDLYYVHIEDQDKPKPKISIELDSRSRDVKEGDPVRFDLKSVGELPSGGLAVKFRVEEDGKVLPSGASGDKTFTMTSASGVYSIKTDTDEIDEPASAITVTLVADSAYQIDATKGSATATVKDDDPTMVGISGSATEINENGGTKLITITLNRELVAGEKLRVELDRRGGDARFPNDFLLTLRKNNGVSFSTEKSTNSALGFSGVVPVITFTGPTGKKADLDLTAIDDKVVEGASESVKLSIVTPVTKPELGGGGAIAKTDTNVKQNVAFNIKDDDTKRTHNVTVAPTTLTLNEGETGEYYILFGTGYTSDEVDGTNYRHRYKATPAYTGNAVTFSPPEVSVGAFRDWGTAQKVTVTAVNDNQVNTKPRTATITHSVAGYPNLPNVENITTAPSVTITINDDQSGLEVDRETVSFPITKPSGHRIKVSLKTKPTGNVTVNVASSDIATVAFAGLDRARNCSSSSAVAPSFRFRPTDWQLIERFVCIKGLKEGKANITFSVGATADTRYKGKTLVVPVTVTADSRPTVDLSVDANRVNEGGSLTLKATLSAAATAATTIPLVYTNGTAEDADYTKATSITVAKGQTEGTAPFATANNNIYEGDETVTVQLGTLPGTVLPGTVTEQMITIADGADLPTVYFLDAAGTAPEDKGADVALIFWNGQSELDSSIDWTTANGTATAGEDYTAASGTITRAASSTSISTTQIKTLITDDSVDDPGAAETFTITLSNASNAKVGTNSTYTVSITDNDPTELRLITRSGNDIAEAAGTGTIHVEALRDLATGESVSAPLVFSGAASFGVDYTLSAPNPKPKGVTYSNLASADPAKNPPTIAFTAGNGHKRVAPLIITAVQDTADEGADGAGEDLTIAIGESSATGFGGGVQVRAAEDRHTFAITDDDDLPTISAAAVRVAEGDAGETPTLRFTVSLSPASGRSVSVGYADAASGTATSGADYAAVTAGALTFAPGETSKTVDVTLTGDVDDEPDETVVLRLSAPVNAVFAGKATTVDVTASITDDDATGVSLSASGATRLAEGDATTSVSLALELGRDLKPGEIAEIPLGVTSATGVAITAAAPANRDYILTAAGTGVTVTGADTAAPKIKFTGGAATERSATIQLTATARDDNDAQHETLSVALGNLADSALATTLSGGLAAIVDNDPNTSDNEVEISITDDEAALPLLNLALADGASAPTEGSPAQYKLTLSPAPVAPLSVKITVAEESDDTLDYIATTEEGERTLTVAASQSVFNFSVSTVDNTRDEDDGGVVVTLVADSAYRIGSNSAHTIAVMDDEVTALTLTRSDDPDPVHGPIPIHEDGGAAELEFKLGKALGADNTVTIPLSIQGAVLPTHATLTVKAGQPATVRLLTANPYSAAQPALEIQGAGLTTATLVLTAVANSDEMERAVRITPSGSISVVGAGFSGGVSWSGKAIDIDIANDDGMPEARILAAADEVNEGRDIEFHLHVRPAPKDALYIRVDFSDPHETIDRVFVPGETSGDGSARVYYLSFPAGRTTPQTIIVTTKSDNKDRPDGWFEAVVAAGQGYNVAAPPDNRARALVIDNDDGPTLSIAAGPAVVEGHRAVFTITRNNGSTNPAFPAPQVNLKISQAGDVVKAGGLGVKQPRFTGDSMTLTYEVETVDDSGDDANARVIAELLDCSKGRYGNDNNAPLVSTCAISPPPGHQASVPVNDNDPDVAMVNIRGAPLALSERKREQGAYEVSLQTDPGQTATVRVDVPAAHTDAVSVQAPGGTPGASATLSFTGGSSGNWNTLQTVTVSALADDDITDETVTLSHTVTGYAGVTSAPNVKVSVTDAGHGVVTDKTRLEVREYDGTATYRVRLGSAPTAAVTVTPVSGNAGAATVSGPLTFTAVNWKTWQDVTVTGVVRSGSAPVRLTHQVSSTDTSYSSLPTARISVVSVSMLRDPRPQVTLGADPNPVIEGASATVTATLDRIITPAKAVTIPIQFGTANTADFVPVSSITIEAGKKSGSVSVMTVQDSEYEPNEGFRVEIDTDHVPQELHPIQHSSVLIKIDDDEDKPRIATLSVSPTRVHECGKPENEGCSDDDESDKDSGKNGEVTVTVTLDQALNSPARAITIPLAYTDSAAVADADYTRLASVTIAAGETQGTGKIRIINDQIHEPSQDFVVKLSGNLPPAVRAGDPAQVTVKILRDGSESPPHFRFDRAGVYTEEGRAYRDVSEGVGMTPMKIYRDGETEATITAGVDISRNEDLKGYRLRWRENVTFSPKDTSKTIRIPIPDNGTDQIESHTLGLSIQGTVTRGWPNALTIRVVDDDPILATLTPGADLELLEGDSSNKATANLSLPRNLEEGEMVEIPLLLTTSTGAALPGSLAMSAANGKGCEVSVALRHLDTARPRIRITGVDSEQKLPSCVAVSFDARHHDSDTTDEEIKVSFGDFTDKTLVTTSDGGVAASAGANTVTLTILDDDQEPDGFTLSVDTDAVAEDVSVAPTITVTAEANTSAAFNKEHSITVSVGASGDQAKAPADYAAVTDFTITVPANQKSATGTFVLAPVDDSIDEADEILSVTGSSGNLFVRPATIAITDDDPTPALTLALVPATISESGAANASVVSASMNGLSGEDIQLVVYTEKISRHAVPGDLASSENAVLTISSGATTSTGPVTLTAVDNRVDSDDKEFRVFARVRKGHGVVSPSPLTLTVTDDDTRGVTIAPSGLALDEKDDDSTVATKEHEGEYSVVLDSKPSGDVVINLASDSTDLTVAPVKLTFTPANWNTAQKVTVTAIDDDDINPESSRAAAIRHTVAASGTDYASVKAVPLGVTIRDDEGPQVEIALDDADGKVVEGGSANVSVSLSGGTLSNNLVVPITVSGAQAADYSFPADITIAAGATSASAAISLVDDAVDEPTEVLTLAIGTLPEPVRAGSVKSVELAIIDGDATSVVMARAPPDSTSAIAENGGVAEMTVTAGRVLVGGETLTAPLTVSGSGVIADDYTIRLKSGASLNSGVALNTADPYSPGAPALVFTGNDSTTSPARIATLEIVGADDSIDEGDSETISLSFGSVVSNLDRVSGTGTGGTSASGAVAVEVTDDEATPVATLVLTPASISESGTGNRSTVTATLSGESSEAVVLTVSAAADVTLSSAKELTIAAGALASSGIVTVTAVDNDVDAPDKQVMVSAGAGGGHGVEDPANAALTITDDDERGVVISEASVSVRESDDTTNQNRREDQATYTVKLASEPTGGAVTIAVASADTNAATVSPVSLVFDAGNWSEAQIVTVSGVNDDIDNTNDRRTTRITHGVSASGTDYSLVTAAPVAVTVTDDDGPPTGVTLSVNPASVAEVAVATKVTVTATAVGGSTFAESKTVAVTVGAASDSAKAPADYAAVSALNVTIAAGATSGTQSFMLTPVDDAIDEGAGETISVSGALSGFTIAPVSVTLTDNDERGVSITPKTLTLDEVDKTTPGTTENVGTYDVVLESQPTGAVTVNLSNSDASVVSLNKTSLSFNATNWSTAQTVTVTAVADAFDNTGNKRTATISHTVSAVGTDYAGETADPVVVTVTDDDEAPTQATLTVSTSSVSEGGAATEVTVTATLSGDSRFAQDQTVAVTVGDATDSATEGVDYTDVDELNITIAGGAASGEATFSLAPSDDDRHEGNEQLSVSGALSGVTFTDTHIDITDDDAAPGGVTLTVSPTSVSEGATKATEVTVTATVTGGTTYDEDKTVTVSVGGEAADSATEGTDYEAVTDIDIVIPAGAESATGTFSLEPKDDSADEPTETLSITGSATGVAITGAQVSITDNDDPPELSVSAPSVAEGDSGTASLEFEVTLTPVSGRDATVGYAISGGTATSGTDYTALTAATLTFAAGETTKTVTVSVTGDTLDEADETVILRLSSASGATLTGGESTLDATGTITDDDDAPSVSVADAEAVAEGNDSSKTTDMTFAVSLSAVSGKTVTVPYTLGGEATAGADYTAPNPLSVTIAAGSESADIPIAVKGDVIDEIDETVTVTLGAPTNAEVSTGSASGTITDDDATPVATLVLTPASIAESGTGNVSTVTATLSGESSAEVVLTVSAAAVSPAVAADFALSSTKELTIAAGALSSSGLVTVTAEDNDIDAANKKVTVSASASGGHGVAPPAGVALTITDDDTRGVVISEASVSVRESDDAGAPNREDQATYTVKLASQPTGGDVTIAVASEDTDAATVSPVSLVFTAANWSEAQIVTVSGMNDDIDNTNDRRTTRITHTVSAEQGADYASVTAKPVAVTVNDDDGPPTGVRLSVNPASVDEVAVATEVTVTATAVGGSTFAESKTVRVTVGAAADSAKAPADYAAVSAFDVTIAAGATSGTQTFMLTPVDDDIDEGAGETISVNGTLPGFTIAPVNVTLTDDDERGVSIDPETLTLDEADDAATQGTTENAKTYDVVLDSQPTGAGDGEPEQQRRQRSKPEQNQSEF